MPHILITGGNFINKGAESMLMSTVEGIRKYFPGYQPILVDLFPSLGEKEKKRYDFSIYNMHVRSLFRMSFFFLKPFLKPKPISDDERKINSLFASASAVFDISGFGVNSLSQNIIWNMAYLLTIRLSRSKGTKVWLLPQSIGPFDFKGIKKVLFNFWGKPLLNYPELAFIREPSGLKALQQIRKKPSLLSNDIVLQTPEDMKSEEGVGALVIPNQQLFQMLDSKKVIKLYTDLIKQLIDRKISVKVIRHSRDDLEFLKQLSGEIQHDLISIDYTDWGLQDLKKMICDSRFVVTGRYHGAIHALKQGKPVILIGWAEKYESLAFNFGLSHTFIDLRTPESLSLPESVVNFLVSESANISKRIEENVSEAQKSSFWHEIKLND